MSEAHYDSDLKSKVAIIQCPCCPLSFYLGQSSSLNDDPEIQAQIRGDNGADVLLSSPMDHDPRFLDGRHPVWKPGIEVVPTSRRR